MGVDLPFGVMNFDIPSAIINFNMPDIWQTVPDSQTHYYKTKCAVSGREMPEKFQLDQIQNG